MLDESALMTVVCHGEMLGFTVTSTLSWDPPGQDKTATITLRGAPIPGTGGCAFERVLLLSAMEPGDGAEAVHANSLLYVRRLLALVAIGRLAPLAPHGKVLQVRTDDPPWEWSPQQVIDAELRNR